jgi:amidohydrolase
VTRDLEKLSRDVHDLVLGWQRTIHADPEIGFDTVRTAALVAKELRAAGLPVQEKVGRTGVVADLEAPGATRRIAFRADMDALPMNEETDLPHKSRNPGAAHLCGHDAHTAMLLGAARALAQRRESLPCSVRFIFQPNEEALPGGAPGMIADGCLSGVDRIYGIHVWPLLETGTIGVRPGPLMAQPDTWSVKLTGKGGHAAAPHEAVDPIPGAAQLVTALQTVVARNVDPLDAGVLSVTQIHAGSADNVIPAAAEIRGTIRSFHTPVGDVIRARLEELAVDVAGAFGLEAELRIRRGYPEVVNDAAACEDAAGALADHLTVDPEVRPSLGGEDFAYYLQQVPGAFLFLGTRNEADGIVHFCHHPRFRVDDEAMRLGVKAWLALGLELRLGE